MASSSLTLTFAASHIVSKSAQLRSEVCHNLVHSNIAFFVDVLFNPNSPLYLPRNPRRILTPPRHMSSLVYISLYISKNCCNSLFHLVLRLARFFYIVDECLKLVASSANLPDVYIIYMKQDRSKVNRKHQISAEPVGPKISNY